MIKLIFINLFRKQKLIGSWRKYRRSTSDITLHNTVQTFKFPDTSQVHITCNVEVETIKLFSQTPSNLIYVCECEDMYVFIQTLC